jgi:hypothetical protein
VSPAAAPPRFCCGDAGFSLPSSVVAVLLLPRSASLG